MNVCIDGAKSMTDSIKGVVSRIEEQNPECSNSHCAIDRHQLATKIMSCKLFSFLNNTVRIVNFVK